MATDAFLSCSRLLKLTYRMFSFVILKLSLMAMVHGHIRFLPVLVMAKARVPLKRASRAPASAPSVSRSRKAVMAMARTPSGTPGSQRWRTGWYRRRRRRWRTGWWRQRRR